jgi:hypothetical protein
MVVTVMRPKRMPSEARSDCFWQVALSPFDGGFNRLLPVPHHNLWSLPHNQTRALDAVVMHNTQPAQLCHYLHDGSHTDRSPPKV